MKINSKLFNFSFFLSGRKKVEYLESGARQYGGATKFNDAIYSNIPGSEYIHINSNNNILSVFVPSTISINQKTNNSNMVQYCINYLKRHFNIENVIFYNTEGSWFSEDLNQVIIENITIISLNLAKVTEQDINILVELAQYIKKEMNQEGVSIAINDALAIV